MDVPQDPWVPAPRDGDRADIRAHGRAGEDPWSPTVPFPRVAPAVERLPEDLLAGGHATALVPVPLDSAGPTVRATATPGLWPTWARAVARLLHLTVHGVRSLIALLSAAPAPR